MKGSAMRQIETDRARQGRWGSQVLMILVCGLLLAAVAWFVAENYGQAIETPATQDSTSAPDTTGSTLPPAPTQPAQQ